MEEKCSFGSILDLNCTVRQGRKNFIIDIDDLTLWESELLKIRSKISNFNTVKNVCKYHKIQFVNEFSNN